MANEDKNMAPNATGPARIDVQSDDSVAEWARRLDVTVSQIKDAVATVGDQASDVEMHLKGSHSTSNVERIDQAGAG